MDTTATYTPYTPELDRLEQRYDGNFDTLPDHPVVTWADRELVSAIQRLIRRINQLEARLDEHEAGGYKNQR